MTTFRALTTEGIEIGRHEWDTVENAIAWAASVGLRAVNQIQQQDGSGWVVIFKCDGAQSG